MENNIIIKTDYFKVITGYIAFTFIIYLFISHLHITYIALILVLFSILYFIQNIEELIIKDDCIIYKIILLKKELIIFNKDFINVNIKHGGFKVIRTTITINYNDLNKNKKDNISIDIPYYNYEKICKTFVAKGIKTTTNDPDLQDIIDSEIRKMKR